MKGTLKMHTMAIASLSMFFGWQLSLPFNGPILQVLAVNQDGDEYRFRLVFMVSLAMGFFLLSFLKRVKIWKKFMVYGCGSCIILNIIMILSKVALWPVIMAGMGIASALFTLGWGCVYSREIARSERIRFMAIVIIISNIIYYMALVIPNYVSNNHTVLIALVPLVAALFASISIKEQGSDDYRKTERYIKAPWPLLTILSIFTFCICINGGLMYNVIMPSFKVLSGRVYLFTNIPYMSVLLVMFILGNRAKVQLFIYLASTLLGMSFISYSLFQHTMINFFLTQTLVEAALAMVDLFIFVSIGEIAFVYKKPFKVFGIVLGVNVSSILIGGILGEVLLKTGPLYRYYTLMAAAAAIFTAITLMPRLNNHIKSFFDRYLSLSPDGQYKAKEPMENGLGNIVINEGLTHREKEILGFLMKGYKNKELADILYISENTIKTHIKNIYKKMGVSNRQELLIKAMGAREKA